MLPVGLIGFILPEELEEGFYAVPPKNKLERLEVTGIFFSEFTSI
jgi:hypothetical protein